ncbi:SDR family oxidoreductase [Spiroplasma turonicum]|uniref:Oxidoreductase n=1 Tax=Spiroplasma turonicum TaxID=216946 RepID=A0A0K1P6Z7_9MOLU|nr:SDR family oxidoreductase [Spiroplasma turonicum]AKU80073.1 oxidoreductase [Spiroplasma turonicum]ALX71075.1 oxidoreductase [Spiroplasma turonicum]
MDKLIVITGASSGIGKELAIQLNKKGYKLLLLARRVNLIEDLGLDNCMCKSVDVKNLKDFKNAIIEAESFFNLKVDLLVNNAGIMPLDKIYNLDIETQHEMIDINIKGVLNGMNCVINDMKNRKTGTIINISSVAGRWTSENRAIYNGTKFAVHAISEQSRRELAQFNVRVLTIAPAIVDTNLLSTTKNKEVLENYIEIKKKYNNGLTSEHVAKIIIYAYELPQEVSLKEIVLSSTSQPI